MIVLDAALVLLALALLPAAYRGLVGPTEADRAVAGDFVFFVFVAAVAVLAVRLGNDQLFVVALVATLARLVYRGRS